MTTWDTTSQAGFTYTNGNLTANLAPTSNWKTCIGTTSKSTGKWYWEIVADHVENSGGLEGWGIGVADSSFTAADFMGHTNTHGVMGDYAPSNGDIWYNSTKNTGFTGATGSVGDVWGVALDVGNARIWFRDITRDAGTPHWWGASGNGTDDPTTPSTGFLITALAAAPLFIGLSLDSSAGAQAQATLRTTNASFTGTAPSGFSAWDPTVLIPTIDSRRNRSYLRR